MPQAPKLGITEGRVELQAGNFSELGSQGDINLPVGDTFAARIAYNTESRHSFFAQAGPPADVNESHQALQNPGDLDQRNVRVGLLWQPSDDLSVKSTTTVNRNTTGGLAHVLSANSPYYVPGRLAELHARLFDSEHRATMKTASARRWKSPIPSPTA